MKLEAIKKYRKAFVEAESSEKIRRALRYNIRTFNNTKFYTGDIVLYNLNDTRKWRGPGKVIGMDSSNILMS